jgi:glycosyl transferase, family 25
MNECDSENATRVEICVISMPSAAERRRRTSAMLEGHDLDWAYFDAHATLRSEDLHYDEALARRHFGRTLAEPEIAVFSSHYSVWKSFLTKGKGDYLLVLEDDVILDVDFPIRQFAAFCGKRGIDYVRLFGKHYAHAVRLGFFYDRSVLRYSTTPAGAQAYLLSLAGARRLTECCRLVDGAIDLVMDRFWETGMPIYSIFPYPVIERYSPTSIPVPVDGGRDVSRTERWACDMHRAISKIRKIYANKQLSSSDHRMRAQTPAFNQIFASRAP